MTARATNPSLMNQEERRAAGPGPGGVVLLALFEHGRPTPTLLEAATLAGALGAELHVVRVLSEQVDEALPDRDAVGVIRAFDRVISSLESTASWVGDVVGSRCVARSCSVVHGEFIEQVARRSDELGARLLVVPAREARTGNVVTALACASNRPVLSARPGGRTDTIVAATDLESAAYPVLWTAAEIARELDASMVAVHNVGLRDAPGAAAGTCELVEIASHLPVTTEAVVRREHDPVAAILDEASAKDAGLVVVGTRRRGWFERFVRRTVASRVVDRAQQSVLVMPFDPADDLEPLFVGA